MSSDGIRLAVVTGTSSGIGEVLARELLGRGWQVVGLARRRGGIEDPAYTHVEADLAEVAEVIARVERGVGDRLLNGSVGRLALVNNAGDLGLQGPIEEVDPDEALRVYAVNVVAPVALMGWLSRRAPDGVPLRIVNLVSGLAERPLPGMGLYGPTKAALRMASMVYASEVDAEARSATRRDATVLSYNPGPVDTPMQVAARSSSEDVLPAVGVFERFASEGRLAPPEGPVADIVDYVEGDGHDAFGEARYGGAPA